MRALQRGRPGGAVMPAAAQLFKVASSTIRGVVSPIDTNILRHRTIQRSKGRDVGLSNSLPSIKKLERPADGPRELHTPNRSRCKGPATSSWRKLQLVAQQACIRTGRENGVHALTVI